MTKLEQSDYCWKQVIICNNIIPHNQTSIVVNREGGREGGGWERGREGGRRRRKEGGERWREERVLCADINM